MASDLPNRRVAASRTPLEIQMAAGAIIRTRAGTSAESLRLTSSRLLTGVETGSQEVARGFPDSHRRFQKRGGSRSYDSRNSSNGEPLGKGGRPLLGLER
jgi:hypothetical protein